MAYAYVASTGTNTSTVTGSINTTGANLIVLVNALDTGTMTTPTDSKGNVYNALTASVVGTDDQVRLFYLFNPIVGTGHTFTQAANYGMLGALAVSGAVTNPFDQQNGATNAATVSLATGSITPSESSELIIGGWLVGGTNSAHSVGGGFTIGTNNDFNGTNGVRYGGTLAYLIQTTATAANPTLSWTGSVPAAARIASFKDTPAVTVKHHLASLGVGR